MLSLPRHRHQVPEVVTCAPFAGYTGDQFFSIDLPSLTLSFFVSLVPRLSSHQPAISSAQSRLASCLGTAQAMPAATTEERSSSQKQTALGRQGSGAGGPNTNSERLLDDTFRLSAGAATATATVVAIPSTPTTVSPRSQRRQRQQQQQLVQSAPATPRREAQALPAASVSTSTANSSSALLGPQHLNLGGSNIAATSSLQGRTFEAHPAPHSAGIAGLHMLTGRGSTGSDDVIRGAHDGTSGNLPQPPTNGYPLATAMKQRSSDARDVRLAERLDYWQRRIVMSGLVGFIG